MRLLFFGCVRLGLALSWPLAFLVVGVRVARDGFPLQLSHLLPALAIAVPFAALISVASLLLIVLIDGVLGKRLPAGQLRGMLALVVASGVPVLWLTYQINRKHLPDFFDAESLIANAGLLLAYGLIVWLTTLALRAWQSRSAHPQGLRAWLHVSVLVLAVFLPLIATIGIRASRGPNVIFLLVDALRYDHLGVYGHERPTSPSIDRFAADSIVFDQAISASSFTKTSIATLLSGLDPHSHGVYRGNRNDTPEEISSDVLSDEITTLPEALASIGVISAAWVENPQIQGFMGFDQGFFPYQDWAGSFRAIQREFMSWHQRFGRLSQYFAYLHCLDLHDPYRPPAKFDDLYGHHADLYDGLDFSDFGAWGPAWSRMLREIRDGERTLTEAEVRQLQADYDEVIHALDEDLGKFFDELREAGLYDDSIIILTSDHGDGFMEHGFISHSTTPYDELVRVPLIVKLPHSERAGTRISRQVGAADLMPTILDLLGVGGQRQMDGRSVRALLTGEHQPDPEFEQGWDHAFVENTGTVGLRTEKWKLLYRIFEGGWEIYDLEQDPGELDDLSSDPPAEVAALQAMIRDAVEERSQREAGTVALDDATLESLRALGYIE